MAKLDGTEAPPAAQGLHAKYATKAAEYVGTLDRAAYAQPMTSKHYRSASTPGG
jgi:hypothetical protein